MSVHHSAAANVFAARKYAKDAEGFARLSARERGPLADMTRQMAHERARWSEDMWRLAGLRLLDALLGGPSVLAADEERR